MKRRAAVETEAAAGPPAPLARFTDTVGHSALAQRRAGPQSGDEAESRYVAARDAWVAAMHAANSGRPADLAVQQRFFEDHISPWAGRFFEDLEKAGSADFYKPVGALGRALVGIETQAFAMAA